VNDTPTASASPNPATTNEGVAFQITFSGTDADDDALSFSITQQPTGGTLGPISTPNCSAVNACTATVTYTPNANFDGADSFRYSSSDGAASANDTVNIQVINTANATDFIVNSTADPGTGGCDVTECTLREAITAANADPDAETIFFNITGPGCDANGVCTIAPTSALPLDHLCSDDRRLHAAGRFG
jgi:CSLREA domain-containing protein